jgi:hypothetical protein
VLLRRRGRRGAPDEARDTVSKQRGEQQFHGLDLNVPPVEVALAWVAGELVQGDLPRLLEGQAQSDLGFDRTANLTICTDREQYDTLDAWARWDAGWFPDSEPGGQRCWRWAATWWRSGW